MHTLVYLLPLGVIWGLYLFGRAARSRRSLRKLQDAVASGLSEPASLHPVINPSLCMGCGACVKACPEGEILGLVHGKARLVEPSNCIGHGACRAACPFNAITLVFGTAQRGVDIPLLTPDFETSVSGIFIAGELGGMGLIRNAIIQGTQAAEAIAAKLKHSGVPSSAQDSESLDLLIIGAGPAGIAASLAARAAGINFLTLEQNQLGGTVAHFPRRKIVMTSPVNLPLVGRLNFRETSKESLLERWQEIIAAHALPIQFGERLLGMEGEFGAFHVETTTGKYSARSVLLCLGRRGTPRTLDVPGEELAKVVYSLTDPEQYQHQNVLVVGGGDSALEAAISLAEEEGTTVTLSYRGDGFSRAKQKNRGLVEALARDGRIRLLLSSRVTQIDESHVHLMGEAGGQLLENDAVIVCAGGILPIPLLQGLGIEIETKYGTA